MMRTITGLAGLAAVLVAGVAPSFGQVAPASAQDQEARLIAVLKSDASQKDKSDACRELARVGTRAAVPALAALLKDESLSHMARYGLEPIPDPAVDEALRESVGTLSGRPLVGVIGSLGVRRDARAVAPLSARLKDQDPEVAHAAARALGAIGTPDAARALEVAVGNAPAANRPALHEGLFRCAEAMTARNDRTEARALYQRLSQAEAPRAVHVGAERALRDLEKP